MIGMICFPFIFGSILLPKQTFSASVVTTSENGSPKKNNSIGNSDTETNAQHQFGEKVIYLREPLLEGQDTIDVSPDTSKGSIGIMASYVTMIYKYILALGSIIAVLVIMFGGIQIMTSAGDDSAMGEAKDMIMRTLTGLAMLFLTGLFLYAINPNFYKFGGESTATTTTGVSVDP